MQKREVSKIIINTELRPIVNNRLDNNHWKERVGLSQITANDYNKIQSFQNTEAIDYLNTLILQLLFIECTILGSVHRRESIACVRTKSKETPTLVKGVCTVCMRGTCTSAHRRQEYGRASTTNGRNIIFLPIRFLTNDYLDW